LRSFFSVIFSIIGDEIPCSFVFSIFFDYFRATKFCVWLCCWSVDLFEGNMMKGISLSIHVGRTWSEVSSKLEALHRSIGRP
jgi:hypothetical protein